MPPAPPARVWNFSQRPMAAHCLMFLLLLLGQFAARNSQAAGVVPVGAGDTAAASSSSSPWSGSAGGAGGEEEEEDPVPVGDRSAQIIRQQDAEEGEGWGREEETAWRPRSADTTDGNKTLCVKPQPPENGYIKGDNYDDGGVVHIFCEEGYALQGPHKLTCIPVPYPGARGIWLPEDEYRCIPAELRVVELGSLGGNHIEEGPSYAVYSDEKHVKKDAQKSSFAENVKCPKPTAPQHGRLEGTDYSLYATVRVTCDEGYHLIGPDHITCLPVPDPFHLVGMWEPQHLPSCQAPPQSTLPLMLVEELGKAARVHQPNTAHTLTHTLTHTGPDASQVEGLQTLCSLPKVVGPCRASIPRFYFDTTVMECRPFDYGGCEGNDNNFHTFSECQAACR